MAINGFAPQGFISSWTFRGVILLVAISVCAVLSALGMAYGHTIYIILIIGGAFALWRFEAAFFVFCAGMLFSNSFYGKFYTVSAILFLLFVLSYSLTGGSLLKNISISNDRLSKVVLLFLFCELLQLIFSYSFVTSKEAIKAFIHIIVLVGSFFITSSYIKKSDRLFYIIIILLICASSEAILAILQHWSDKFYLTPVNAPRDPYALIPRSYLGYIVTGFSTYVREARGTFGQFNGLGNFLTFFSPLAFAIALVSQKNHKRKLLFWFVNIIIFLGLYFSYSRGSLMGVLIGGIIILLLMKKLNNKIVIPLFIGAILFGGYNFSNLATSASNYWSATQNLTERILIWDTTLSHIMKSPSTFLFGYHYLAAYTDESLYRAYGLVAGGHNSYLSIWEAKGLVGLILILLILVLSIRGFYSAYKMADNVYVKHISLGLLGGLIAFSISQLFDHKLAYFFDIRTYFFIILGISVGIKKILKLQYSNLAKRSGLFVNNIQG